MAFDRYIANELQGNHAGQRHAHETTQHPHHGLVPQDVAHPTTPPPEVGLIDGKHLADVRKCHRAAAKGTGNGAHKLTHAPTFITGIIG